MRELFSIGVLVLGGAMAWQFYAPEHVPAENLAQLRSELLASPVPADNPERRLSYADAPAFAAASRDVAAGAPAPRAITRRELAGMGLDASRPGTQRVSVAGRTAASAATAAAGVTQTTTSSGGSAPGATDPRLLARHVQTALRRVGCYDGKIDGIWGSEVRQSMIRFGAIQRAEVQVDRPSRASLALVQQADGRVCGTFGRVPETEIAKSAPVEKPAGLVAAPRLATTARRAPLSFEGRMTVGGPPLEHIDARAAQRAAATASAARQPTPPDFTNGGPASPDSWSTVATDASGANVDPDVAFGAQSALGASPSSAPAAERKQKRSRSYYRKKREQRELFRQAFGDDF